MQTITVPGGRRLGYTEMGDPDGTGVIYQHGWQYPRLWHPDSEIAREAGVRLVCVDRAGYGESTLQPGRTMTDSAGDVTALADHLGIDRLSAGRSASSTSRARCGSSAGSAPCRDGCATSLCCSEPG
ncbi:MAG: hypothetical protein WCA82_02685 [Jiangellales bacterium]